MNRVVTEWNIHRIRKSRNSIAPAGRPDILYSFPEIFESVNYIHRLEEHHIQNCKEECIFLNNSCSAFDIAGLCEIIMQEMNIEKPINVYDGITAYIHIRAEMLTLLSMEWLLYRNCNVTDYLCKILWHI